LSDPKPLKLAILWHMHQPDYQEADTSNIILPWVRLHATKDYLDMPLRAASHDGIKTTFNLVPSLLDQLQLYLDNGSDPHLTLSRLRAEELTDGQKGEILKTFFCANPTYMIEPYPRFFELYKKNINGKEQHVIPELFTSAELRDIQVWSNLVWVDPYFRSQEPCHSLIVKGKNFSEEDKHSLLDWMLGLLAQVVPTYVDLYNQERIDISFTPYYHPILPLLCDTDIAREALPGIKLPQQRFQHPEDAEMQIEMSMQKYESLFGRKMTGMWPSEGSISEQVADICMKKGIKWIASDEEILFCSLKKSGLDRKNYLLHTIYEYGPGLKLFFRDRALSDRIGFVYSGWDADRAVLDFVDHLKIIRKLLWKHIDDVVVPVILDGENAWEYFPDDGAEFLDELYRTLSIDPEIKTITMSEAANSIKSQPLKSIFAGSWINHNFRIWIGHHEDNQAWDLLGQTRDFLEQFQKEHPDYDSVKIAQAWTQIFKAEGSDWCWWYGDEHRGHNNEQFDQIYRRHLIAVYELLDLDIPLELLNPIYSSTVSLKPVMPDSLVTPKIDGYQTHFYEWAGTGYYDCQKAGGAMHRVDKYLSKVYFAYDYNYLYIRLDFIDKKAIKLLENVKITFNFFVPDKIEVNINPGENSRDGEIVGQYHYCFNDIFEIAFERKFLLSEKFGTLSFNVSLYEKDQILELQPESKPVKLDVPEKDKEMFWPS